VVVEVPESPDEADGVGVLDPEPEPPEPDPVPPGGDVVVVVLLGGGGTGTVHVNPLGSLELEAKVTWTFQREVTWPTSAPCLFTQASPVSQTPAVVPSLRSCGTPMALPVSDCSHAKSVGTDGS
jgi:hypothetical protein